MRTFERSRGSVGTVFALLVLCWGCGGDPTAPPAADENPIEEPLPPIIVFDMVHDGQRDIWRVELDGTGLTNLTEHPGVDVEPTVAGDRVVFTSYRDGNAELYAVPATGGDAQRLTATSQSEINAALSRDGSQLAFAFDSAGVPKLWSATAEGTQRRRISTALGSGSSLELQPDWGADGHRIVFVSTHGGTSNLYIKDRRDGSMIPFMAGPAAYIQPAWSPDGRWIAFTSNQDGSTDLYTKSLETSQVRRLTNRVETDAQPAWLADDRLIFVRYADGGTSLRWLNPNAPGQVHEIPLPQGSNPMNPAGRW